MLSHTPGAPWNSWLLFSMTWDALGRGSLQGGGSGESLAMARPGSPILTPRDPAHVQLLISNKEVSTSGKETRGRGTHWVPRHTRVIRHLLGVEKGDGPSANPEGLSGWQGQEDQKDELQASWIQLLAESAGGFPLLQHGGG